MIAPCSILLLSKSRACSRWVGAGGIVFWTISHFVLLAWPNGLADCSDGNQMRHPRRLQREYILGLQGSRRNAHSEPSSAIICVCGNCGQSDTRPIETQRAKHTDHQYRPLCRCRDETGALRLSPIETYIDTPNVRAKSPAGGGRLQRGVRRHRFQSQFGTPMKHCPLIKNNTTLAP